MMPGIESGMSTRRGGVGEPPFDSFNLALDPRDAAASVNRQRWAGLMGAQPVWLHQVHGMSVAVLTAGEAGQLPPADASVAASPGLACTVMVADCLPVLLCADNGRAVGAAHAGWRGLAGGVLEQTVLSLCRLADCGPDAVQAWLGPCIGPRQFEVGEDVLWAFGVPPDAALGIRSGEQPASSAQAAFVRRDRPDGQRRWLADLPRLARQRLAAEVGLDAVQLSAARGGGEILADQGEALFL